MTRKTIISACAIALLSTTVVAPASAAEKSAADQKKDTYRLMELFADVFQRVRSDYVDKVSSRKLIYAALNGMLSSLDAHSGYLDPKEARDMDITTRGAFGGLGIEVTMQDGWIKVVSPIDDTPAFRAGIQPGDLITAINGDSVHGMTLSQAVDRMRGPPNSKIRLTIHRGSAPPFDVTLTRAVIKIKTVRSHPEGDVGYIRITQFSENTDADLRSNVAKLKKEIGKKLIGYVIDLRNNPGGLLDQAIAVSDDFLNRGEIVSTRSRHPEDDQRFFAHPGDIADGLPIVVLINDGTASAAEIVSGALKDNHRAIIMGTRSFGKGSVQTLMPLPDNNGEIRLTTALYYTPSGASIQAVGIKPNIRVLESQVTPIAIPDNERLAEARLLHALPNPEGKPANMKDGKENLTSGVVPAVIGPKGADGKPLTGIAALAAIKMGDPAQDYQLARAIDFLRGLAVYKKDEAKH